MSGVNAGAWLAASSFHQPVAPAVEAAVEAAGAAETMVVDRYDESARRWRHFKLALCGTEWREVCEVNSMGLPLGGR